MPSGIVTYAARPPTGSSPNFTTPSNGARTGVPAAANRSVPWCRWNVGVKRGIHQSSVKRVGPATGKWPNPTNAACWGSTPNCCSGPRSAISASVEFGALRFTDAMIAWYSGGTTPGWLASAPAGAPAPGAVVVVEPEPAGLVVDVVVDGTVVVDVGVVGVVMSGGTSASAEPASVATATVASAATRARRRRMRFGLRCRFGKPCSRVVTAATARCAGGRCAPRWAGGW